MDTLEALRREAYAAGLSGRPVSRDLWTRSDEFSVAYQEAWLSGSLAATAPETAPVPAPARIVARG